VRLVRAQQFTRVQVEDATLESQHFPSDENVAEGVSKAEDIMPTAD
jgi:hypothetical protein